MRESIKYEKRHRELAHRVANGIEVSLYWVAGEDDVVVAVIDHNSQQAFELSVAGDRALDAFHHPYAYAARQGVESEALLPWAA